MNKPTLLISGADGLIQQNLKDKLFRCGFNLVVQGDKNDVLNTYHTTKPDLVIICSSEKISENGLKRARALRHEEKNLPIILITRFSSEARAIAALRAGVTDYFKLPLSNDAVVKSIRALLSEMEFRGLSDGQESERCSVRQHEMIGESDQMREIKAFLNKVARSDSTVLITGETGTGKELAAQLIHCNSIRKTGPFVSVNCAALPESLVESELFGFDRGAFTGAVTAKRGKFELAKGGTIFLDEIGDMNPYTQAKILRSIENKEVFHLGGKRAIPIDARIVSATNQDPERLMSEGKFRKDLYYRLNIARIQLPPLRERKKDIPRLVACIIEKLNRRFGRQVRGLSQNSMASLYRYDWPGNVRELMNLLEVAYINLPRKKIDYADIPKRFIKGLEKRETLPETERWQIVSTLQETNWNKSTAAQKLNWSRMTLYRKIEKYKIVEKRNR
jgi:DNA-binding NtrC family response regulator